ncbi:MAG: VWA domain-containing protein [Candidatus Promineifilaceae bacterium]
MALIAARPWFWLALVGGGLLLLWLANRRRLRWRPAWLLRFSLLAAGLFLIFEPRGQPAGGAAPALEVLIVDRSDSVDPGAAGQFEVQARAWQAGRPNRLILLYGAEARPLLNPGAVWPEVDGRGSNLAAGLAAAADWLADRPGRVILASDGLAPDSGQVRQAIARLVEQGNRLDVVPLPPYRSAGDLSLGVPQLAASLWEETPYVAIVPIQAAAAGQANVEIRVNGELELQQAQELAAGDNFIVYTGQAPPPGPLTFEARLVAAADPRPENNQAYAVAQVFAAPRVLWVAQDAQNDEALTQILAASGLQIEVAPVEGLSTDLGHLSQYDVLVLSNVLARNLRPEQFQAIQIFVLERGGGLLLMGGRSAYTLGGYEDTPLAPLLPVEMKPPTRSERSPTTFVLVLDRSSSMGEAQPLTRPIELAREAAIRAIEVLEADDLVGVLTYSNNYTWDAPIAPLGDGLTLRLTQDTIMRVSTRGTTHMHQALSAAVQELAGSAQTESRLILLLSDGVSTDGSPQEFLALAQAAHDAGIAISTIALGGVAEAVELMELIAQEADGRFHLALEPSELPRIMVAEGEAARAENIQLGRTNLVLGEEGHPVLSGLSPDELPPLAGYNALASKREEGAEDILLSGSQGDPILSARQAGLGRVVAWMSDTGEEWTADWLAWPKLGLFWSQVLRYALLNPAEGPAAITISDQAAQLRLEAQLQAEAGAPLNAAEIQFAYRAGEDQIIGAPVPQVGPGAYALEVAAPEAGAYPGVVRYQAAGREIEVPAPFAVNYPAEWRPGDASQGQLNLADWARLGGGDVVTLAVGSEPAEAAAAKPQAGFAPLLLALILAWPLEILARRRWLPWR